MSAANGPSPFFSVIVPVRDGERFLPRCLSALAASTFRDFELLVVDDGSTDRSAAIGETQGARVLRTTGIGPAGARNEGARASRGETLLFVDADCEVHHDTLAQLAERLRAAPEIAAAFGSYDDASAERGFVTEWKNLQHHYVHQHSSREASTFWAGCGAVRRQIFFETGGFDDSRFARPSVEDIDLGSRMRAAGRRIALVPEALVKHHKRWTAGSLLATDLFYRAVPWSRLMLSGKGLTNDLNLDRTGRVSGAAFAIAVLFGALALQHAVFAGVALAAAAVFVLTNLDFYRFLARRRGVGFAVAAVPLHLIYYAVALAGLAIGTILAARDRLTQSSDGTGRRISLYERLTSPPVLELLALAATICFLVLQLWRSHPWIDDVVGHRGDDWVLYRQHAVDIVRNGLFMPGVGDYKNPSGFLYNYFVAAVFAIFGENSSWLYAVQAVLLGIGLATLLLGFRRRLGPRGTFLLMLFLGVIGTVDVFFLYTKRLLSENLLFVFVPLLLLLVVRVGETGSRALAVPAGITAGIAFLTRPNTILMTPIFAVMLMAKLPRRQRWIVVAMFLAAFLGTASLLPLRNYVVTGRPSIALITQTRDWLKPQAAAGSALAGARSPVSAPPQAADPISALTRRYLLQSAFLVGATRLLQPAYPLRPDWMVLWGGVLSLIVIRTARGGFEWWELVLFGFTVAYAIPIISIPTIDNYGFRMVMPLLGALAVLSARGYVTAYDASRRSDT